MVLQASRGTGIPDLELHRTAARKESNLAEVLNWTEEKVTILGDCHESWIPQRETLDWPRVPSTSYSRYGVLIQSLALPPGHLGASAAGVPKLMGDNSNSN